MTDFFELKRKLHQLFLEKNIDLEEVNILFCEALNCSYADLIGKSNLSAKEVGIIMSAVKKRLKGMPIQKIFKRAYFYGLTFAINNNVLCPRPETELLVEEVLNSLSRNEMSYIENDIAHNKSSLENHHNKLSKESNILSTKNELNEHNNILLNKNILVEKPLQTKKFRVLDICTGSGAIAVALAKNCNAKVFASDISPKALYVAKKNAKKHGAEIKFIKSDMFANIKGSFDIIVSNPPYIPTKQCENLDVEVKNYDPIISLDGGVDGLDFYKILATEAPKHLNKNGKLLVEVGFDQAKTVKKIFEQNKFDCYIKKDYNNIERIVVGELK